MRIQAVVTDYDGTLTMTDHLSQDVIDSLRDLKSRGVALVLCTGRNLERVYGPNGITDPQVMALFDLVVAESGGVVWNPRTDRVKLVGRPVSPRLLKAILDDGIVPTQVAQTMINVRHADVPRVEKLARDLGIRYDKVLGIQSVQFVTPGVRKSLGMRVALAELRINPRRAATIGDGPNDLDMLDSRTNGGATGCAVGNAVPDAKKAAAVHLKGNAGQGFIELAGLIARDALRGPSRGGLAA